MKKTFNASRKVGKSFLEPSLTSQCFLGKAFCTTTQLVEATIRFFYFFCSSMIELLPGISQLWLLQYGINMRIKDKTAIKVLFTVSVFLSVLSGIIQDFLWGLLHHPYQNKLQVLKHSSNELSKKLYYLASPEESVKIWWQHCKNL